MKRLRLTRRQVAQNLKAAGLLLPGTALVFGLAYVCVLLALAAAGFQLEADALEKVVDRLRPATQALLALLSFGLAALTLVRLERAARRLGAEMTTDQKIPGG
jgi:hypothetical protein